MRRDLRPGDLGDLLSRAKVATLGTQYADGTTLLSPVWHEWSEDTFTFVTFSGDIKLRHIQRDPRVSLLVAEDEPPYRGIEVRGRARVFSQDGLPDLRRMAERYLSGRDIDGYLDRISAWMKDVGHAAIVVVHVDVLVLRAWDYADEEW